MWYISLFWSYPFILVSENILTYLRLLNSQPDQKNPQYQNFHIFFNFNLSNFSEITEFSLNNEFNFIPSENESLIRSLPPHGNHYLALIFFTRQIFSRDFQLIRDLWTFWVDIGIILHMLTCWFIMTNFDLGFVHCRCWTNL